MAKRLMMLYLVLLLAMILAGCGTTLKYQGKDRPASVVEDMIEDQLEAENPNMDIEVDIQEGNK